MVTVPGYQIERLLNWGSQGDVFLATDRSGRKVALKVVTPDRVQGEERAVERLRREARLLAAITSPHVVVVHEFLESDEWSCLVLEYLEGKRLEAEVRERGGSIVEPARAPMGSTVVLPATQPRWRVPEPLQTQGHVDWALGIARQLAEGVAELHAIGLLHRDLKPQNAMLVDGRMVLIDFGFARMTGVTTLTQSGAAVGTLAFMSPEQFRGGAASKQSDVYGLGATIYFCLVGSPPIDVGAGSLAALAKAKAPPRLRRANRAVSSSLAAVVARALQPDPRDRYADAEQLRADLERCQRGERVRLPFSPGRLWRNHRRTLASGGFAMLLGLLAWWLWGGFDAGRVAGRLLEAVANDPAAAAADWQRCLDDEQLQITDALNERLGGDGERALQVARVLHLGVLRVGGRPAHYGSLQPSEGDEAPRTPAAAACFDLDQPRSLLVRPGRAWFFVGSRNRIGWWSDTDPLVLQSLIDVAEPGESAPERSLRLLRTELNAAPGARFVAFPAAEVQWKNQRNELTTVQFADPMAAASWEVDGTLVHRFHSLLRGIDAAHSEMDAWMRHPDEPAAAAAAFWQAVAGSANGEAQDLRPALLTFWAAHRFAAFVGCRLPGLREWQRISRDGNGSLGTLEDRVCEAAAVAVDSEPRWDRTRAGICFANSNVREWTLQSGERAAKPGFAAVPAKVGMQGATRWSPVVLPVMAMEAPDSLQGLRLYRTVLLPR